MHVLVVVAVEEFDVVVVAVVERAPVDVVVVLRFHIDRHAGPEPVDCVDTAVD